MPLLFHPGLKLGFDVGFGLDFWLVVFCFVLRKRKKRESEELYNVCRVHTETPLRQLESKK